MLGSLLFNLMAFFVGMFNLLPDFHVGTEMFAALTTFLGYGLLWDGIFPVSQLYYAIFTIFGYHIAMWVGHMGVSLLNWFRGAGEIRF